MGNVMYMRKGEIHSVPHMKLRASDLPVGSSVYLMEDGSAVEYLVVNQGIPGNSDLYDPGCDGTWLLRKDLSGTSVWDTENNDYTTANIQHNLTNKFLERFDRNTQDAIRQVKIPYRAGKGTGKDIASGASGFSAKVFLLSATELNWTSSNSTFIVGDGACLSYFSDTAATDSKRIAYLNGTAMRWWLRSPAAAISYGDAYSVLVTPSGVYAADTIGTVSGIRPALVLPFSAEFDEETRVLKGVT